MKKFLKYFNFFKYKILGTQNIVSNSKKIFFTNSGISSLKKIIFKKKKIVSFQICVRLQGIYNDLKNIKDNIHKINFLMLGNFSNLNFFFNLKISLLFLFYIKINDKKLFFTLNKKDYESIIIFLILKINKKRIFFLNKNIWKLGKNGFCGFSIEFFYKIKNIYLEIWNIVNINYLKLKNILKKTLTKIIDTGLGVNRIIYIKKKKKKKNFKLFDLINSFFLLFNNITKYQMNFLNKIFKKIFFYFYKKKIKIYYLIFWFFYKKKNFFYSFNLKKFFKYILNKEITILNKIKKVKLTNNFIKLIKNFETNGFLILFHYNLIKKNFL